MSVDGHRARADVQKTPRWSCIMIFEAKGIGAAALGSVSYYEMKGSGRVTCVDSTGSRAVLPVQI